MRRSIALPASRATPDRRGLPQRRQPPPDERQPVRAVRKSLSRGARAAGAADPGRGGHPLRPARRRIRAHGACPGARRMPTRRPRRGADRQALAGARSLSRLPARGLRLPASEHRLSAQRAVAFLRRRRAARHRLPARGRRGDRRAGARRHGADAGRRRRLAGGAGARAARRLRHRRARAGRPRRTALHLGHDGPVEGRHAHPPQPRVERTDAGRAMGLHPRRRPAARAADLPRARPLRRRALHAAVRLADALAPEIRRCGSRRAAAARDGDDGRADVLYAAAGRAVVRPRGVPRRAAVRLRLRAAARRDLHGLPGAHGAHDPRALRDDRDGDERVQSARRPAARGNRRPAAARRVDPDRRRGRRPLRAGDGRRRRSQGTQRVSRLLADAGEDARGIHRRRLLPHRRHGRLHAGALSQDRRAGPRTSSSAAGSTSTPRRSRSASTPSTASSRAR